MSNLIALKDANNDIGLGTSYIGLGTNSGASVLPFKKNDLSLISFEKAKLKSKILQDIFSSNFELKKDFIYFNPYLRLCELECKKIVANNIFLMKDRIHFTPFGIDYINELNNHFLKKLISDLQSQSVY